MLERSDAADRTIALSLALARDAHRDQQWPLLFIHARNVLALDQTRPDALSSAIIQAARGGKDPASALRETVGCTPADLGAALAERWHFPPTLVRVIYQSGSRAPDGDIPIVGFVRDARAFIRSCGLADGIGEGSKQVPPSRRMSPPLGPVLESAGGGDGILERADAFLTATAA